MKRTFSAWREGAILYAPWFLVGAAVVALTWPGRGVALGAVLVAMGLFALFFFRDPPRAIPQEAGGVVSPADGTVVGVEDLAENVHYDGPCRRISIFLSLFNVHINRAPVAGTVRLITYQPGGFKAAMAAETTDCNEANTVHLDTEHGPVTVRQISGLVARCIVCRAGVGDRFEKGEKFGMIKFGSRTELYLPPETEVCVTLKDKVRAGASMVARFSQGNALT